MTPVPIKIGQSRSRIRSRLRSLMSKTPNRTTAATSARQKMICMEVKPKDVIWFTKIPIVPHNAAAHKIDK